MSNVYCTVDQLLDLYDRRTMRELSSDEGNRDGNTARIQTILDVQASELESHLSGRYPLPLPSVPAVLTKWVAATTAARLFARRNDKPKQLANDEEWAGKWIEDLRNRRVSLAGIERLNGPALSSSDYTDGRSRFDRVLGGRPSPTGPSRGL